MIKRKEVAYFITLDKFLLIISEKAILNIKIEDVSLFIRSNNQFNHAKTKRGKKQIKFELGTIPEVEDALWRDGNQYRFLNGRTGGALNRKK